MIASRVIAFILVLNALWLSDSLLCDSDRSPRKLVVIFLTRVIIARVVVGQIYVVHLFFVAYDLALSCFF